MKRVHRTAAAVVLCWMLCLALYGPAVAQISGLPPQTLSLASMESFHSPSPAWSVVGTVRADRPGAQLAGTPGTGVLYYNGSQPSVLQTAVQHGDIEVDLEFMLEDESCSALLLQGRYEVRLCGHDSSPAPSSLESGRIVYGASGSVQPQLDAARTPGVWQRLTADFRAPRFAEDGRKTANARLERVALNGVTIHRSIEIPEPSASGIAGSESELGPLSFRGSHSGAAFRNVAYKQFGVDRVTIDKIRYAYYEGWEEGLDLSKTVPTAEGTASELSLAPAARNNNFALRFEGLLDVPESGLYVPDARARGDVTLTVAGRDLLSADDGRAASVELTKGQHPFVLVYTKAQRGDPALSVFVEGPGIRLHPITSGEGEWHPAAIPPIPVEPDVRPYILRNYVHHDGRKKVNGIFVGDPTHVHYSLDLDHAALLYVWRGPFLNLGPVWTGRGMEPDSRLLDEPEIAGSRIAFAGKPTVAFLRNPEAAWPDTVDHSYRLLSYQLDDAGRPTFKYRLGGAEIHDRFVPSADGSNLMREIAISGDAGTNAWIRLAEGDRIEPRRAGFYSVDDAFFLEITSEEEPVVRTVNGQDELLVPVRLSSDFVRVSSKIIW